MNKDTCNHVLLRAFPPPNSSDIINILGSTWKGAGHGASCDQSLILIYVVNCYHDNTWGRVGACARTHRGQAVVKERDSDISLPPGTISNANHSFSHRGQSQYAFRNQSEPPVLKAGTGTRNAQTVLPTFRTHPGLSRILIRHGRP